MASYNDVAHELMCDLVGLEGEDRQHFMSSQATQAKMAHLNAGEKLQLYQMFRGKSFELSQAEIDTLADAADTIGMNSVTNAVAVVRSSMQDMQDNPDNSDAASERMITEGLQPMLAELADALGPMLRKISDMLTQVVPKKSAAEESEAKESAAEESVAGVLGSSQISETSTRGASEAPPTCDGASAT